MISVFNSVLAAVFVGIYYASLTIRDGYMIESIGLLPLKHIPVVIVAYVGVALYFATLVGGIVAASIKEHTLLHHRYSTVDKLKPANCISRFWRRISDSWTLLFVPAGIFELSPECFVFFFLLREVVEVVTQTYQASNCSTLIAQPWINTYYVSMLAANCWVTPIIHLYARHQRALQRFLFVCSDVFLDFASAWIISTTL